MWGRICILKPGSRTSLTLQSAVRDYQEPTIRRAAIQCPMSEAVAAATSEVGTSCGMLLHNQHTSKDEKVLASTTQECTRSIHGMLQGLVRYGRAHGRLHLPTIYETCPSSSSSSAGASNSDSGSSIPSRAISCCAKYAAHACSMAVAASG